MRIALTGAHSTGKSTLVAALATEIYLKGYTVCGEITRRMKTFGVEINERGTDATQLLIMNQHIANVTIYDDMLVDRCALDGWIYTDYLHGRSKVSDEVAEYAWKAFYRTRMAYDHIFYIEPIKGMNIINDGTRSTSADFQHGILQLYKDFITGKTSPNIPKEDAFWQRFHVIESAPIADRVMKIRGIINAKN